MPYKTITGIPCLRAIANPAAQTKPESGTTEHLTLKIHIKFISLYFLMNYISLESSFSQKFNTSNGTTIRGS